MSGLQKTLKQIADVIESFNEWVGRVFSWLATFMVLTTIFIVLSKAFFSKAAFFQPYAIFVDELVKYLFSTMFMLGIAYTLKNDNHIRVDIFYQKMSEKGKATVNLLGTVFFLFPVCILIFYYSFDWVVDSWMNLEKANNPGGIDFIYGLKTLILIMPVLVFVQGIAIILNSIVKLTNSRPDSGPTTAAGNSQ
jgi:TRAP-type mannitol/chloroaromatic compound transport system permease small subunit